MTMEARKQEQTSADSWHGERGKKLLKCSIDATAHMREYMKEFKAKLGSGEPVIWIYRLTPYQIFQAMDILNYDMQHYSALISAKQMSRYYLDRLNTEGYFRDLCRYCTVPLGYAFDKKPDIAPWGGLPKFTAAVFIHNDDPSEKIWELYAREFDIPMYYIDQTYFS